MHCSGEGRAWKSSSCCNNGTMGYSVDGQKLYGTFGILSAQKEANEGQASKEESFEDAGDVGGKGTKAGWQLACVLWRIEWRSSGRCWVQLGDDWSCVVWMEILSMGRRLSGEGGNSCGGIR
eukprot:GHVS01066810.1.p2 GENE.GHVS01066810.1~~GHVS01066810.1.p2  ORF type:complete len:122 (+),score=18.65 GHVS01066810.1:528-893(+)